MKKTVSLFLVFVLSITLFTSCSTEKKENQDILLVTSFYPIYIFTLNVVNGIDEITTKCMAEQSVGCLHDYQLLSKDAKLIADASVLIINGAGMELFLEDVYNSAENLPVIDSSENVYLLEECHEEHISEHEHHSHNVNSHIWLSVDNAVIQVKNICKSLVSMYPQYKEKLELNTEEYIERLNILKNDLVKESENLKGKNIITFHESFSYLANDYGFNILETVSSHEGGEPSAKKLAALTDVIKTQNVKTIFVEENYSGSSVDILKNETAVKVSVLNPVTSGEVSLTAYEDIMRKNIKAVS